MAMIAFWIVLFAQVEEGGDPIPCNGSKPKAASMQFCGNVANNNCAAQLQETVCDGWVLEDRAKVTQDCEAASGLCCVQHETLCYERWGCRWDADQNVCVNNVLAASVTTMAKVEGACCEVCGNCVGL